MQSAGAAAATDIDDRERAPAAMSAMAWHIARANR